MRVRTDQVFRKWAFSKMVSRKPIKGTLHVAAERDWQDGSLAEMWGIVPTYTGKVIRRKAKSLLNPVMA